MDIANILSGGVLGGLTGLAGSVTTAIMAYKNKKLDLQDKKDSRAHSLLEMDKEADHAVVMTKMTIRDNEDARDSSAMEKAMGMIKGQLFKKEYAKHLHPYVMALIAFMFAVVDIFKALVRPGGTVYLLYVMSIITFEVYERTPELFFSSVVDPWSVISYMGATSFMWWFGDRRLSKVMASKMEA